MIAECDAVPKSHMILLGWDRLYHHVQLEIQNLLVMASPRFHNSRIRSARLQVRRLNAFMTATAWMKG